MKGTVPSILSTGRKPNRRESVLHLRDGALAVDVFDDKLLGGQFHDLDSIPTLQIGSLQNKAAVKDFIVFDESVELTEIDGTYQRLLVIGDNHTEVVVEYQVAVYHAIDAGFGATINV